MLTRKQLKLRKSGIGGSDAAAVAGLSRYKSNVDVYLEKIGYKDSDVFSEPLYWGSVLEKYLVNRYRIRNNNESVSRPKNTIVCKNYPWMLANIDGFIDSKNAVLECKTTNIYKSGEWGEQGTDEIPDEYLLQCAHYRVVTSCDFVAIALLIGNQEYREYRYEKNSKLEDKLINIEHDFWHLHVLPQEPPKVKTYADALKLFNLPNYSSKLATEGILLKLHAYKAYKERIGSLEELADKLKAEICGYLENDSFLTNELGGLLATWKSKTTKRFNVELFKKTHPKLYGQFIKDTQSREFRVIESKEKR